MKTGQQVLREALARMPKRETKNGVDGDALAAAIQLGPWTAEEKRLGCAAALRWMAGGRAER